MDSDKLREACEMAGMEVVTNDLAGPRWGVKTNLLHAHEPITIWAVREGREWIESRCADLLVGKVPNTMSLLGALYRVEGFSPHECFQRPPTHALLKATPAQRITAAMAVLKGDG